MTWAEIVMKWTPCGRNFLPALEIHVTRDGLCSILIGEHQEAKGVWRELNPKVVAELDECLASIPMGLGIREVFARETNSTIGQFQVKYQNNSVLEFSTDLIGYKTPDSSWNPSEYLQDLGFREQDIQTVIAWEKVVAYLGRTLPVDSIGSI